MSKRKFLTFFLCLFIFSLLQSLAIASEKFSPEKHIVLFYRVNDTIFKIQNDKQDVVEGRKEFEKTLADEYKKRFFVDEIRATPEIKASAQQYVDLVKHNQIPLIVSIEITGQHMITQEYQNAFGARISGSAPAIDMTITEDMAYPNNEFHGYGPVAIWWSPGTYALDRHVYTSTDNRKNTKNAVKYLIKAANTFNKNINEYANPQAYNFEVIRYKGDFEKWRIENMSPEQKQVVTAAR